MIRQTWQHVKKILCVRLDNMGDVIMTSPAIRALKESFPTSQITLLTSPSGSNITPFLSMIDNTITYSAPWMKQEQVPKPDLSLIQQLQKEKFDAGICFSNFSQNSLPEALLLFLSDIPLRLGYARENPQGLLTDWVVDKEPFEKVKHGVTRQIDLVKAIGAQVHSQEISFSLNPKDILSINALLTHVGIDTSRPFCIVHPGASDPIRRFPLEILGATVARLTKTHQVVVTGVQNEEAIVNEICRMAPRAISLCNKLSIGEFMALISQAYFLLSNNTGPVHVASGLKVPVVVLYARTNPEHTPWQTPHAVLYFDVPSQFFSKNQLLRIIQPKNTLKPLSSLDITIAVETLLNRITNHKNLYA